MGHRRTIKIERLQFVLDYNPYTGVFTRKSDQGNYKKNRSRCRIHQRKHGAISIMVDGRTYYAKDLAWFYLRGKWPSGKIIHRDGHHHHNWIENLIDRLHKNPEEHRKNKARWALNHAVQDGRIKRHPCCVCGALKSQGHHHDYSKPLDVKWLCARHHTEVHRNPRTIKNKN